jgi:hypothetical protein
VSSSGRITGRSEVPQVGLIRLEEHIPLLQTSVAPSPIHSQSWVQIWKQDLYARDFGFVVDADIEVYVAVVLLIPRICPDHKRKRGPYKRLIYLIRR